MRNACVRVLLVGPLRRCRGPVSRTLLLTVRKASLGGPTRALWSSVEWRSDEADVDRRLCVASLAAVFLKYAVVYGVLEIGL